MIVGDGPERVKLEQKTAELRLEPHVQFLENETTFPAF